MKHHSVGFARIIFAHSVRLGYRSKIEHTMKRNLISSCKKSDSSDFTAYIRIILSIFSNPDCFKKDSILHTALSTKNFDLIKLYLPECSESDEIGLLEYAISNSLDEIVALLSSGREVSCPREAKREKKTGSQTLIQKLHQVTEL